MPYRVSVEPIQNWRQPYAERFAKYEKYLQQFGLFGTIQKIMANTDQWFKINWTEKRKEPLPRLGATQLLFRKEGPCEDIADLRAFILRSIGVPATVDIVPYWATSFGSHFLTVAIDSDSGNIVLDNMRGSTVARKYKMRAEPGKVLRTTFSKQKDALATYLEKEQIPDGILQFPNLKDVTSEYWPVEDIKVPVIIPKANPRPNYVLACVFNTFNWRPVWWGKINNNTTTFRNMSKGVVYMPMIYKRNSPLAENIQNPVKGILQPAGFPVAVGNNHTLVLKPDTMHLQTIELKEQDRFLIYRPDKKYTLYYWNNKWMPIGQQKAHVNTKKLTFNNVPQNALLLLIPEYSQGRERPFIVQKSGTRIWF